MSAFYYVTPPVQGSLSVPRQPCVFLGGLRVNSAYTHEGAIAYIESALRGVGIPGPMGH